MIYLEPEFPLEYLDKSKEEKITHFKSLIRTHEFFKKTEDEIIKAIFSPTKASIVLVIGPTGAGKSKLCHRVIEGVVKKFTPLMEENRGIIPIAMSEVPAPGPHPFSWRNLHSLVLKSLHEILIDKKIDYNELYRPKSGKIVVPYAQSSSGALLESNIQTLINRGTVAYIFDEANHFTHTASAKQMHYNLEYIKYIANRSNVPHILFGTYDLQKLRNLNGQLIRRSLDIHFPRYHANNEKEKEYFQKILVTLLRQMPLGKVPDPLANDGWEFYYERSIGCIGILKDWLVLALDSALENGKNELTMDILKQKALSISKCLELAEEAKRGEEQFCEPEDCQVKLRQELGLEAPFEDQDEITDIEQRIRSKYERKNGNQIPGIRKAVRDAVGL